MSSAFRELIHEPSGTFAGLIGYIELPPFTLQDVTALDKLLIRGGFPRSYLAESEQDSFLWREGYINTFLEKKFT